MTTQRKECKSTEFKPTIDGLPDDVIQHMLPMMLFQHQKIVANTSKTATFWVARELLADLVDFLKLKDVRVPESLEEANKIYKDLMRQHRAMMYKVIYDFISLWPAPSTNGLDARYIKHLCNYDRKYGGFALYSILKYGNAAEEETHRYEIANQLIDCGADVNWRHSDGDTPLLALIRSGSSHPERLGTLKLLLAKGADITPKADDKRLAWRLALNPGDRNEKDQAAIIDILLPHFVQKGLVKVVKNTTIKRSQS